MPLPEHPFKCLLRRFKRFFVAIVGFWTRKGWPRQSPKPSRPVSGTLHPHDTASHKFVNHSDIVVRRILERLPPREALSGEAVGINFVVPDIAREFAVN